MTGLVGVDQEGMRLSFIGKNFRKRRRVGEEGEQGRAWLRALRSINNPEAELSSIHVRSADPGVCMKNPEGNGSSIHIGREVGGVFIISDVFFATKERWVRRRK